MEVRIRVRTRPPHPLGEGEIVLKPGRVGESHVVRMKITGDDGLELARALNERSVTEPVFVSDSLEQALAAAKDWVERNYDRVHTEAADAQGGEEVAGWTTTGLLNDILEEYGRDAFVEAHAAPWLVQIGDALSGFGWLALTANVTGAPAGRPDGATPQTRRLKRTARVWSVSQRDSSEIGQVSVGRAKENDVVLPDAGVSKQHAYFTFDDGTCRLVDAESSNGTWIDGKRIDPATPVPMTESVVVRFGTELSLLFCTSAELAALLELGLTE